MAKIAEYPALTVPTDQAELPVYDPTTPGAPDKKITIGTLRTGTQELENKTLGDGCAAGTADDPVPVVASQITVDDGAATAETGESYEVTINKAAGLVTTDSLSTAAGSGQDITVNCDLAAAGDMVFVSRNGGTSANGTPVLKAVAGAGTITITLDNKHASAAFNGTFIIAFLLVKSNQ